ncbi:hypothetical protein MOTE_21500 [Moorella thermoacetica]|uniref:Type 4 fimbrial biogenesis protein PilX N-terminal domain-containing protein n=1 Tax=Neomoorella thermoacetica TaxID=1525 RepID=A0A1J5NHA6_NEOTH|nr:hypothetical protein MOTE_21500 [Moorella thermoacetica]
MVNCKQRCKESGQIILLVVMVTAIIFLLGMASVTVVTSGLRNTMEERDQMQSYYVAEAGAELALARIQDNPAWLEGLQAGNEVEVLASQPYAGGSIVRVTLTKDQVGRVTIISKGKFGAANKTVRVSLTVTSELLRGFSVLPGSPVNKKITGNFNVVGNGAPVILNGSYDFKSGAIDIKAPVYASGTVAYKNADIQEVHEKYPVPSFPEINLDWYKKEAQKAGHYYTGSQTFGSGTYNGIYFVDGNITISGTYTGRAVIVASGNINLPNGNKNLKAASPPDDLLVLMAPGLNSTIDINNGDVDTLIIANYFTAKGNGQVNGNLLVRDFDANGNIDIYCHPDWIAAASTFLKDIKSTEITSWGEGASIL